MKTNNGLNSLVTKTLSLISLGAMLVNPAWSAEDSVYDFLWLDPDKSVYVLQNKTYKKEKTFGVDVSLLKKTGDEFQTTYGIDLKANYYFTEEFGLEAFYTHYSNSENDTYDNLKRAIPTREPFMRKMNSAMGAMVLYSPFYGKVNTFNKIFYFDWNFGLGLAQLDTESNISSVLIVNKENIFESKTFTAIAMKTAFKVHLSRRTTIGLEVRNFMYKGDTPGNGPKQNVNSTDLMIGLGIKF